MGRKKQAKKPMIVRGCDESWDEMMISEMGRFCERCQHEVIDSQMLTREQFFALVDGGRPICGRLSYDARDQIIFKQDPQLIRQRAGLKQLISVAATVSLVGLAACDVPVQSQQVSPTTVSAPLKASAKRPRLVKKRQGVSRKAPGVQKPMPKVYDASLIHTKRPKRRQFSNLKQIDKDLSVIQSKRIWRDRLPKSYQSQPNTDPPNQTVPEPPAKRATMGLVMIER